jgi:hypothetical protein
VCVCSQPDDFIWCHITQGLVCSARAVPKVFPPQPSFVVVGEAAALLHDRGCGVTSASTSKRRTVLLDDSRIPYW